MLKQYHQIQNGGISLLRNRGTSFKRSRESIYTKFSPYDIPGVELTHEGEFCSFEAILKKYEFKDEALCRLATIVRAADTDTLEKSAQAAGLFAISAGLSHNFKDDHEMLKHGMVMYDAPYSWCKYVSDEIHKHNW